MNCPWCGGALEKGTFHDRGDSFFLPAGKRPPMLISKKIVEKRGAVWLPPESFGGVWAQRPAAFWCGACRKLLVDYSELMSPKSRDEVR